MLKLSYNTQSYQPTSIILLRIILNRLFPQAEDILAEEQAGFRKIKEQLNTFLTAN